MIWYSKIYEYVISTAFCCSSEIIIEYEIKLKLCKIGHTISVFGDYFCSLVCSLCQLGISTPKLLIQYPVIAQMTGYGIHSHISFFKESTCTGSTVSQY